MSRSGLKVIILSAICLIITIILRLLGFISNDDVGIVVIIILISVVVLLLSDHPEKPKPPVDKRGSQRDNVN